MKLFRKSEQVLGSVVDTLDAAMVAPAPGLEHIPADATGEHPASYGDDINLVLMVKEVGARKKVKMVKRREALVKELEQIDKELLQLDVLLDAANSL